MLQSPRFESSTRECFGLVFISGHVPLGAAAGQDTGFNQTAGQQHLHNRPIPPPLPLVL